MGLMDMIGGMLGRKAPKSGNPLLDTLLPMLLKGGALGGLAGLLAKFAKAGLGAKADSWVSTGPNESVDAADVERALGSDTVGQMATAAGVSSDKAAGGLAAILPSVVNGLTPDGTVPTKGLGTLMKGLDFSSLLRALG